MIGRNALCGAVLLAVSACAPGSSGPTVAQAQAEAGILIAAMQAGVAAYAAQPGADPKKLDAAQIALGKAQTAYAGLEAVSSGNSPQAAVAALAADAQAVLAVVPLPPAQSALAEAALVVIEAVATAQPAAKVS